MRLFTVPSLYFQVLGIGFSRFQDIADLRIAPMGQLRRFGLNISEINTSRTRRLLYPSGLANAALEILGPYLNVDEIISVKNRM